MRRTAQTAAISIQSVRETSRIMSVFTGTSGTRSSVPPSRSVIVAFTVEMTASTSAWA